jgi:hypothetical protein
MKVLIACEESQTVTKEMRSLGVEAYSCDIEPCSGGHPEWHIQDDVINFLGKEWDLIIAFPPCTYLTIAGTRHFSLKTSTKEKIEQRKKMREDAVNFFMEFVNVDCKRVAIENPVVYMNTVFRKPDQIIHPYYFGEPVQKRTCLWLKGLPKLILTEVLDKPKPIYINKNGRKKGQKLNWCESISKADQKERAKLRSKTFECIAKAMATQYISFIKSDMTVDDWEKMFETLSINDSKVIIEKYLKL